MDRASSPRNAIFGVALCVGAGIDYFAGVQRRCPKFLARIGMEWIWRLLSGAEAAWTSVMPNACCSCRNWFRGDEIRDARRSKANS